MGEPSDAGTAPLRSSVVSLTNGPSIMILGRLGCLPDPDHGARPDSLHPRDPHLRPCLPSGLRSAAAIGCRTRIPGPRSPEDPAPVLAACLAPRVGPSPGTRIRVRCVEV